MYRTERKLGNNFKVRKDHFYIIVHNNEETVIIAKEKGTVDTLSKQLIADGYTFKHIYWCDIKLRKL